MLQHLTGAVLGAPQLRALAGGGPGSDLVGPASLAPFVAAGLADSGKLAVVVTATVREAEDLVGELHGVVSEVELLPAWETLPHERMSPRLDTMGQRIAVLRKLRTATGGVVVAPARALLQPLSQAAARIEPLELRAGVELSHDEVATRLAAAAYERVDLVERRGQFAVRGGIVDVFPPTAEHPFRVDFFGDEIEEIRSFAVADQRTIAVADEIVALPCRELLLTDEVRARAAELARSHPAVADLAGQIAEGIPVEGMESLLAVLEPDLALLTEVLPADASVLVLDPERVRARAADLVTTNEEFLKATWTAAGDGGAAPIDLNRGALRSLAELRDSAADLGLGWWTLSPFGDTDDAPAIASVVDPYHGDVERLVADLASHLGEGRQVVITHPGKGPATRTAEVLAEHDIPARLTPEGEALNPAVVEVIQAPLAHGFVLAEPPLVLLTGADLSGQRGAVGGKRPMPTRRRKQIDPLELKPGDYVVHDQHGVGRFVELKQREVAGTTREYLVLEYGSAKRGAPPDHLFVPVDALDQVTRYVGGEQPSLDRLGGSDWARRKGRARKAVRQIAAELIKLYAARQATKGHAFGPDTVWQRELEDAFEYTETPDQLSVIDEVKRDMQRSVPMDRLVCGDVGYGKTEIAVRAAFKAVQDGKQVAVLVPTTLLVNQHLATFTERISGFPVRLGALSRFQTDAEARAVVAALKDGSLDIVIGTHRLLTPEVSFHDLGLVIVDEEQRFGVEHKERLKQMRADVDVLAMSATPIPRTLEMAITGIREMSTITTPPEERLPVLTYVGAHSDRQAAAAIRRELLRDGQVFWIHNRVSSIDRAAARIAELVPEARVAVAHGQMGEAQLERVMLDFWEKRFDVLVCTTIVESGIDVSNANTMVIERADQLGLSQLHQLRGRVGRSRERAYAYFLYPPDKPLTETAHQRLATLAQHSDLGGGMAIALKDLEIRGAGNLLGGEQSGHIADVGFDLYVRMVGEAVTEFRAGLADGEGPDITAEMRIDLPVDAHLPHDYIGSERLRLEMYKHLAEVTSDEDVEALAAELDDRYGAPPPPVQRLLQVARLRVRARAAGVTELAVQGRNVRFAPVELPESRQLRLSRLHRGAVYKAGTRTMLVPRPSSVAAGPLRDTELLEWVTQVFAEVLEEGTA